MSRLIIPGNPETGMWELAHAGLSQPQQLVENNFDIVINNFDTVINNFDAIINNFDVVIINFDPFF